MLEDLYNKALIRYYEKGERTDPSQLLAMRLLAKKDIFSPLKVDEGNFYNAYKTEIDEEIKKVTEDFEFTDDDYIYYIKNKVGFYRKDTYQEDKTWYVFGEGIGSLHWGLMYMTFNSGEDIYNYYFDDCILKNEKVKTRGEIK